MSTNYFGIVTCPSCGLKVSLSPADVLLENHDPEFLCRNCRSVSRLPQAFMFKQTSGRDLTVEEALQFGRLKKPMAWPTWVTRLFARDP